MRLAVMKKLDLDIIRPYKDLFSFDSKSVQWLGMINYLMVRIIQIPKKYVMMDVVIPDVPPSYGVLLSRHSGTSVGGSIQFDISHMTSWTEVHQYLG